MAIDESLDCVTKFADKISEESDRLEWDELAQTVCDALEEYDNKASKEDVFFGVFQFLYRLKLRVKHFDTKQEFNKIYQTNKDIKHEPTPFIRVVNYDYKMFKWARKKGFTEYLDNNMIEFPESALDEKTLKQFKDKIKN